MALVFVNGGSPNYTGVVFQTTTNLLELIRDNLITAGWTVTNDQISASDYVIMECVGNGSSDPAYFRFRVIDWTGVTNGKELQVNGDLTGDLNNLSPTFSFYFIEGADNIIYLTCDEDSGALFVEAFDGTKRDCHFGFLARYSSSNDPWGWMIGRIDWRLDNAYWAKSYHNGSNWRRVGDDYTDADDTDSNRNMGVYQGTMDRYTVFWNAIHDVNHQYERDDGYGWERESNRNIAYKCYNGGVNPVTGKPVLGEFFYLEGRGSRTNYGANASGSENAPRLYYRGPVKHITVGLASLVAKTQYTTTDGKRYLSVNGLGYQGMRIL